MFYGGHVMFFAVLVVATTFPRLARADVPVPVQALIFNQQLPEEPTDFVYCLSVGGEDASSELIDQLQRTDLRLVGASECTQSRNPRTGGSFHTTSRQKAMFFRLSDFSNDGPAEATVEFESYHHGLFASGSTLRLQLVDGMWRIAEVLRVWVA